MKKNKGFTLVELLVVIVILGILITIIMPRFTRIRFQALLYTCEMNEKNLATALESYYADDTRYYPANLNILVNLTPKYINSLPKCPSNQRVYDYASNDGTRLYTISCAGDHTPIQVQAGYPQYSKATGSFRLSD